RAGSRRSRCRHRLRRTVRLDRRDRSARRDRGARAQAGQDDARRVHRDRGPQRRPADFLGDRDARARVEPQPVAGRARPSVRRALKIGIRVAPAGSAIILVYLSVVFVQVYMAARRDDARPADAIIVLGAAQFDGRPSKILAARLDHAIDLYRRKIAPIVVVTGGKQPGDRFTEASAGAEYLHEHDVPDSAILRETTGRSSWQSLAAAARV